jgi:hypothetical protein
MEIVIELTCGNFHVVKLSPSDMAVARIIATGVVAECTKSPLVLSAGVFYDNILVSDWPVHGNPNRWGVEPQTLTEILGSELAEY